MARHTGAKLKLSRREGTDLFLKSARRSLDSKCKADSKPGQHGRMSGSRTSDYGMQLREKQKVKRMYGMLERQFRRYFAEAERRKGNTGLEPAALLESRLDNVVYRMGFGSTRAEARQMVSHARSRSTARSSTSRLCLLKAGDTIAVREKSRRRSCASQDALQAGRTDRLPGWVEVDAQEDDRQVQGAAGPRRSRRRTSTKRWSSSCIRAEPSALFGGSASARCLQIRAPAFVGGRPQGS